MLHKLFTALMTLATVGLVFHVTKDHGHYQAGFEAGRLAGMADMLAKIHADAPGTLEWGLRMDHRP